MVDVVSVRVGRVAGLTAESAQLGGHPLFELKHPIPLANQAVSLSGERVPLTACILGILEQLLKVGHLPTTHNFGI
jgi:hypothetical protein